MTNGRVLGHTDSRDAGRYKVATTVRARTLTAVLCSSSCSISPLTAMLVILASKAAFVLRDDSLAAALRRLASP